jgi:lipopolysaccharide export LptBFGC system permease protein LptF
MRNAGSLRKIGAVVAAMRIRTCLFWGIPIHASLFSERDKQLLKVDMRTRRRLTFVQKIPVRVLMALPLALLFATRSKGVLLVGLLLLGLLYVPFVGLVGFYFTHKLGPFELHLRRSCSHVRTGMWQSQK